MRYTDSMSELAELALGTWQMGGLQDTDPDNDDQRDIGIIKTAIDCGVTLIDTAQNYANGHCEELVGEAVADYPRDRYQILTKQRKSELHYDEVVAGCHSSLKRLGLEYIDYFVCHAPNPDTDMREFFKATNQLYKEGLIKQVGVSNFGPKNLQIALDASEQPIALNQVCFSLADYDIISSGTYEFCHTNHVPIQAYRVFASLESKPELASLLSDMATRMDITTQQLTVAYLHSFDNVHFTIRSSTASHWQDIQSALRIELSNDIIGKLRNTHKEQKGGFGHFLTL